MKILMIECDAEELRANRTVADTITDAFSTFTENLVGTRLSKSAVMGALARMNESETSDEDVNKSEESDE